MKKNVFKQKVKLKLFLCNAITWLLVQQKQKQQENSLCVNKQWSCAETRISYWNMSTIKNNQTRELRNLCLNVVPDGLSNKKLTKCARKLFIKLINEWITEKRPGCVGQIPKLIKEMCLSTFRIRRRKERKIIAD